MRILYEPSGLHTHIEYERRPTKREWANPTLLSAIPCVTRLKARFDIYPDEHNLLYPFHRVPDTSKGTYTGKEL